MSPSALRLVSWAALGQAMKEAWVWQTPLGLPVVPGIEHLRCVVVVPAVDFLVEEVRCGLRSWIAHFHQFVDIVQEGLGVV